MSFKAKMLRALLPRPVFERVRAVRSRLAQARLSREQGLLGAAARYVERNGTTVKYGPFAGTIYPSEVALSRHSIPKLLGTYEQELHDIIREIARRRYDLVVNIGSGEGYYAVGLARLLGTKVLAYDPEPSEQSYCEAMAELNRVSTLVERRSLFQPSEFQRFADQRVLCVCDCEGFEETLFHAGTIPDVAMWDLLIELHGAAVNGLSRLAWPHRTSLIASVSRQCDSFPELEGIGDQHKLLSEWRTDGQTWLWCDSLAV